MIRLKKNVLAILLAAALALSCAACGSSRRRSHRSRTG